MKCVCTNAISKFPWCDALHVRVWRSALQKYSLPLQIRSKGQSGHVTIVRQSAIRDAWWSKWLHDDDQYNRGVPKCNCAGFYIQPELSRSPPVRARACTTATGGLVFFIAADVLIPKAVIFVLIESKRPVPGLYSYTDVINGSYWGHRSCAQWRFISHALSCDSTDVPNNYMYTLYTLETFVPPLIHSLLLQKWKLQVQISDYLLLWGHICFKFQSLVCIYFA